MKMTKPLIYNTSKIRFNDNKYSDINFTFPKENGENDVLYAHSTVLFIESPRLYDLGRGSICGNVSIKIQDKNFDAFREMLRFIYLGRIENEERHFTNLLALSQEYSINDLEAHLMKALENVTMGNVFNIFQMIVDNELSTDQIATFIRANYTQILNAPGFLNMKKEMLDEFLKIDQITDATFIGEVQLFLAILKYIDAKMVSSDPQAKRKYLGDAIFLVRFPTMNINEFASCLKGNDSIITSEERLQIVKEIGVKAPNTFGFSAIPRKA